jgi:murein DD-endopeptidase MepM/ murein hydrolase activator NlpD
MNCLRHFAIRSRCRWVVAVLILVPVLLLGCSEAVDGGGLATVYRPTAAAGSPTFTPVPLPLTVGQPTELARPAAPLEQNPLSSNPTPAVTAAGAAAVAPTTLPPVNGSGVRPAQAQLLRPPEIGPQSTFEWRPPPVPVPYALHPDDHYWLMRPIPSDSRNFQLEWYPFGNEPNRAEALPYRIHHGMDFPNEPGTPIFAASSGMVIWAGPLPSGRDGVNYYGNTVVIQHDWQWLGQDVFTLYAHTLELFVEVGETVETGQLIAGVGATGGVSGPHLHLEVRVGSNHYGNVRNPALWLAPYEGWGTLAGRFVDRRGRMISEALITVKAERLDSAINFPLTRLRTYNFSSGVKSDDVWRENFAFADLPAGLYTVELAANGRLFKRTVEIRPGLTNFIVVQADFEFFPTPTPLPTLPPEPTMTPEATPELPPGPEEQSPPA